MSIAAASTTHLHDGPNAIARMATELGASVVRLHPAPPTHRDPLPRGHHLIGLCGAAGSGKSTAAAMLVDEHGFSAWAFAEPLRDMLCAMFEPAGIDHAWLTEPHLKERPIPALGMSGRMLMQTLGTDWGRKLDPHLWVRITAHALGLNDLPATTPVHDRIVLTDVRFPNEAAWIQALGGHVVLVDRPGAQLVRQHESEAHYRRLGHTATLDNSGGLEQLRAQVAILARHVMVVDALPLMP